ncbi:MAG: universal stress protein [Thermoanaerobaculia bacterium]|nr:universal stress protein [Thermoanaerobaculia bacterium]
MRNRRAILIDDPSIGNQEAIARLGSLAGTGPVTVLVTPGFVPSYRVGPEHVDMADLFLEEEQRRAEEIVEQLRGLGVEASAKVRVGVRPVEIIREVLETKADFVIKVSEDGNSRTSPVGSTDSHLLRQCPCPVWITRPREQSPYRRVFAAIDPQGNVPGRAPDLDDRILEWAIEICRADQAELVVVHAWEMDGEGLLIRGRGSLSPAQVDRLIAATKADHESRVDELLAKHDFSGIEHTLQIVKGRPSDLIPAALFRGRADLIVMGTVARTGIAGFFIGNTAERIIPQVGCSILAVKPEGFVSPVEEA